jgi:hypothetical protein
LAWRCSIIFARMLRRYTDTDVYMRFRVIIAIIERPTAGGTTQET